MRAAVIAITLAGVVIGTNHAAETQESFTLSPPGRGWSGSEANGPGEGRLFPRALRWATLSQSFGLKKGANVFSPKGWDNVAQRNALGNQIIAQAEKKTAKDTRAAEFTRDRYLKVKVSVEFKTAVPVREILKEFAAQVSMDKEFDHPVMWTYEDAALGNKPIAYTCEMKEIDAALNELAEKLKFGYFVVSEEDHPRDGWVRITAGAERGFGSLANKAEPKIDDEAETKAAERLAKAKEQIDKGRTATAKAVLNGIVDKYPKSKAAKEAKALLEKLDK